MSGKIKVAVLGATGIVGQSLVALLEDHPWFETTALCASGQNVGKKYAEVMSQRWKQPEAIPAFAENLSISPCSPGIDARIVFSALDSKVAGEAEEAFARAGYFVCSNAKNHRMRKDVPLVIPEVNADHLTLLDHQDYDRGGIITNPNCSTIGLALSLAPLHKNFGIKSVTVTTLQAISGAGYPGLPAMDLLDNVLPYISGEEEKIETETNKILGEVTSPADFDVSARCFRVPVLTGHTLSVSVSLEKRTTEREIIEAFEQFNPFEKLNLPTAPKQPIVYLRDQNRPQPRADRDLQGGMAVTIGRLGKDTVFDFRYVALVNNLIRGAAGAALLNAELLVSIGYVN